MFQKFLRGTAGLLLALVFVFATTMPALAAPPANDDFANATIISTIPFDDTVDSTDATVEAGEPTSSCSYWGWKNTSVWYIFTPVTVGTYSASISTADFTPVVTVFTGNSLTSLTEVGCQPYVGNQVLFHANAGTTYYFQMSNLYPWETGGTMQFHLEEVPPPANDAFADATIISSPPYNDSVDATGATAETGEPTPSCAYLGPITSSVWYAFTPSADGMVSTSIPGSAFNPVLAVYTGSSLTGLTELGCQHYTNNRMLFNVNAGSIYYFQVSDLHPGEPGGTMQFHLEEVPPPTNDAFADAKIISSPPYNDSVDTTAASVEAGEPTTSCTWNGPDRTVWYAFTPTTSESFSASIPSADFTPVLAVYTGSSLSGLTELSCRTYAGNLLTFHTNAGTTYYFQIINLYPWETGGNMQLNLEVAPAPIAAFYFNPGDPSIYDTVQFYDQSYDPGNVGIQIWAWNFGDGATSSDAQPAHLYKADGDYTIQLAVTTYDARTVTASQVLQVRTHDAAITKITAPLTAKAGQVQKIIVAVKNQRYAENVQVDLYKSVLGGTQWVGAITQNVPVRKSNQTSTYTFNYTFTANDAVLGKVSFKAVASIVGARDALPGDNVLISSPPTKVSR
jgi:PKD domain